MSVNGVTNSTKAYDNRNVSKPKSGQNETKDSSGIDSTAAVYEKSDQTAAEKKVYKTDTATLEKMKAEAERRFQSLRQLVHQMMDKQGMTYTDATDIYSVLREGKLKVDPQTREQAQKDIAVDGYWGIEQTSERILSFAKALTGGDPSKANEMIDAVKKGLEQAKKAWGGDLPDICKQTIDTSIKKLEAWRDGTEKNQSMSNAAADSLTGQAAAGVAAK